MPKCNNNQNGPQERSRSKSMPECPLDSPASGRSQGKCSNGTQNGNTNTSYPVDSRNGGVSTRSRKRLRSESILQSPLDSAVKWRSPRRLTNTNQGGNDDVSYSDNREVGSVEFSTPERKKLKSGLMPVMQTDSPGKWRSPRRCMKGIQNEIQNVNISEKSSLARSRGVCTPEQKISSSELMTGSKPDSPVKRISPRRCTTDVVQNGDANMVSSEKSGEAGPGRLSTPKGKKSMSKSTSERPAISPAKRISPRRCTNATQNGDVNGFLKDSKSRLVRSPKSPRRRLLDHFPQRSKWNPRDSSQMNAVKEALHVSKAPSAIVCREEEQKRVFEFCKACIEHEKAGSLYVCGCPGTGKTLSMEKVKGQLLGWAKEMGLQPPDVLALNCTSLATTSEIFIKILQRFRTWKKIHGTCSPLQHLQNLFCQKKQGKTMLVFVDELDYLITKDRSVLHDLFMLTTFPFSRFILIGIANAIDLADRFLPKLQSLNCKPMVVTFRAYSKEQILRILEQRLMALACDSFQPQALELCSRKVAAASGDMRKALSVCRSAIEILEAELQDISAKLDAAEEVLTAQPVIPASEFLAKQEVDIVRVHHMAIALSKTFKSAIVDTIQSLPQHQQIILCSAVKLFHRAKKDTTIGELNKSYAGICKTALVPQASMLEFSNMCRVLGDQGLIKLGQSREEKLKRVTLKVDESDIIFALQGIRFFRNCLQ